jgi:DNA-binding winged helix-turn-helix (wHTH) protein
MAIHRFGEHRFDPASGLLEGNGKPIPLRPRALALLEDLMAHRARRVTRSELARRVWRCQTVTASSFSTLVAELRKALGDDGRRQAVIRTLGSDGYRFVAEVRVECEAPPRRTPGPASAAPGADRVEEYARPHHASFEAAAHAIADRSLETALVDGPRHLEVTGPDCDAFVHDWACIARDRGLVVHRAHCVDADAPPLWPWWQIAVSILDSLEPDDTSPPARSLRALWHRVWVEIGSMAHACGSGGPIEARQRRFVFGHDVARALLRTAHSSPCVVTLEGARGVDADGARLLRFLLAHMDRSPLWIVTSRPARGPANSSERSDPTRVWPRSDRIRLGDGSKAGDESDVQLTRSEGGPARYG